MGPKLHLFVIHVLPTDVPEDLAIRKACVVPNHEEPHNHPILSPTKTPVAIKEIYRKCIGIVGSSVRTVDNGEVYLFLQ